MYYSSSDGRSYCKLAAYIRTVGGNGPILSSWNPDYDMYYWGDRSFGFDTSLEAPGFISGWVPTGECLGIPESQWDTPYPIDFRVHKPDVLDYSGPEDYHRYYATGSSFFTGFPDTTFKAENQVMHLGYRGHIMDIYGDTTPVFRQTVYPSWRMTGLTPDLPGYDLTDLSSKGYGAQMIGTDPQGHRIFQLGSMSPYVFSYPTFSLQRQLETWDAWMGSHGALDTQIAFLTWSTYRNWSNNSTFGEFGFKLDVEYDYDLSWNRILSNSEPGSYATFHVHKKIDLVVVPYIGNNFPSDLNFPGANCFRVEDNTEVSVVSSNIRFGGEATVGDIPRMEVFSSTIASSLLQEEMSDVPNFVSYRFADKQYLNRRTDIHKRVFDSMMDDLRPSSFLSSADALNKHLEILSTNHLQTLQKLSDVMGLLPDLVEIPRLIKKIASGDISALKDLIDYVTDAILRYRFSQAPAAKALDEVLGTSAEAFLQDLGRRASYTIYGDFTWEFPPEQNPYRDGKLVLVTRSKVRISSDLSTLMGSLLMANSVGLLPTLSRIWEILPFSFVVDWFTGMNRRLKLFDTQLAYMAFRTDWCLHSYKLIYYPSDEALEAYNLMNPSPEEPFCITAYKREKSVWMPRLQNGAYDFVSVNGANPITAGALVWQLFS